MPLVFKAAVYPVWYTPGKERQREKGLSLKNSDPESSLMNIHDKSKKRLERGIDNIEKVTLFSNFPK